MQGRSREQEMFADTRPIETEKRAFALVDRGAQHLSFANATSVMHRALDGIANAIPQPRAKVHMICSC